MKKATALIDVVEKLCEDLTNAMHERWEHTRGKTTHNYSIGKKIHKSQHIFRREWKTFFCMGFYQH